MTILARVKTLNISEEAFTYTQYNIQRALAPTLRCQAMQHLATSDGVVAKSFRGEYLASGMGDYKDFLQTQSRTGAWGTYIEASALGEMMGCHVVVTPVKEGVQQKPICLYRASDDKAPTVHLYNADNTHWYVNSTTLGDGNCLFNAFAQALQTIVKSELPRAPVKSYEIVSQFSAYKARTITNEAEVIRHQQAIASAIWQHPTPSELEASLQFEKARIEKLSASEQQQIADDHKLALACEEITAISKPARI